MNEQQLHEIAVAYAQVKLRAYQEEHKDAIDYNPLSCDSKKCTILLRHTALL